MKGTGVSPGIAVGKALLVKEPDINIERRTIDNEEDELKRLEGALDLVRAQIEGLYGHTRENVGEEEASIFGAHLMILDDPEVFGQIKAKIKEEKVNSEWAIKEVTEMFVKIFDDMDNEFIKERKADLKDVTNRVVKTLLDVEIREYSRLNEEVIIVAEDLTPSDTARMDREKVLGFITEIGGRTSHSAIMARTLEIPAVVGANGITETVKDGDMVVFDGNAGEIIINPDKGIIEAYRIRKKEYEAFRIRLNSLKGEKTITRDGFEVELAANIGTPEDVEGVIKNDGEGVGLFRTEFLYMGRDDLPGENEQFEAYKTVGESLEGKPVVIRTLDIGGDKDLPYFNLPKEMNPFLGYRAIRICIDRTGMFKTQLRALLRASAYGNIKIMFPMISSIEELRRCKAILNETKDELRKAGIEFDENTEVGIMVEIPSAAIMSDLFAKEVDFFSIGSNDLLQYTTAVDRGNNRVSHLYNHFHPALLRLIKQVIDNGHKEGIWVGMCGEAAGSPKLIPVLIGMGLDEFSMSSVSILKARWIIRNISQNELKRIVDTLVNLSTAEEVERFIENNIGI